MTDRRTHLLAGEMPQPIDQLCYNCGNALFAYDGRARCIYCGAQQAVQKTDKE